MFFPSGNLSDLTLAAWVLFGMALQFGAMAAAAYVGCRFALKRHAGSTRITA